MKSNSIINKRKLDSNLEFFNRIEVKWQCKWEKEKVFEAKPDLDKKKFFITFPYPYMNGPLHVGHIFTGSRVDSYARFKRMQGFNVLFPWSWHWTGQPILGSSLRVANKDENFIRILREMDGVPEDEIIKFADPLYLATYYTTEGKKAIKKIGFSVDWRREFNTINPAYQQFIKWQYENLKNKNFVSKGTHPVVWCPKDKSPTGDHDRQIGEGVSPEEYILIKFKLNKDIFLPAATFRPETIYGVTNIWINPDGNYVEAKVDSENWIISTKAAEKLKEQGKKIIVKRSFKGKELVGKTFVNPINEQRLLILPGWFVDTNKATGVVYSVPAHAPYDWLALNDLKEKTDILIEFGINPKKVKEIKPISLIHVDEFGDYPAIEIVKKLGIKDQHDSRAEEATKLIYKKEFHDGKLKENCLEYSGKKVSEVKDIIIEDFKTKGIADSMYELTQEVVCRCLTPCIVKVLQDQWFLNYSDPKWKKLVIKALDKMKIYPETARKWFLAVIDWLKEWACVRRTGFGTPLPWEKGWLIETLSDSTIYMAFYTINNHIIKHNLNSEKLTEEVFDYIFYGKGHLEEIAKKVVIDSEIIENMHKEFLYWYPVDLRVSAKELVPNHLTFFIFHHTALFKPDKWPKSIGVNGMLMINGKQMHKSKGNFVTMNRAIRNYGADTTRLFLLLAAEGMDDPDWRSENVLDFQDKIRSLYNFSQKIISKAKDEEIKDIEKWLLSRIHCSIVTVTKNLQQMKTRTALENAFFGIWKDFRWYRRRKGNANSKILCEALSIWIRLLAPFIPHICEEIWSLLGKEDLISTATWPKKNEKIIDNKLEESENLIRDLIEDTYQILRATKVTPSKIFYYTSTNWKWNLYLTLSKCISEGKKEIKILIKEILKNPELKPYIKEIVKILPKIKEEIIKMPKEKSILQRNIGILNENEVLVKAKDFLSKELNADIQIFHENDSNIYDPKKRAKFAKPYRPAIFIQ